MTTINKSYFENSGFTKINGKTFSKGDLRVKLFYQTDSGDYVMMSFTSKSKSLPKREYRIPETKEEMDKYIEEYLRNEYSINQFAVKGVLLDKGEENPMSGIIVCNVELIDRGGGYAVVPVEFHRGLHSKLHYIEEQSDISIEFKLVSIFAKNRYIPKIIATNVE